MKIIVLSIAVVCLVGAAVWSLRNRYGNPASEDMRQASSQGANQPEQVEKQKLFAYVRGIDGDRLVLDRAEFLGGEEAIAKGMIDKNCPREKIEECIPSLNNGFYIRNPQTDTEEFVLSPQAEVLIFESVGSPVLKKIPAGSLKTEYSKPEQMMKKYLFLTETEDRVITGMTEQYTP